jgi:hypothetical protein
MCQSKASRSTSWRKPWGLKAAVCGEMRQHFTAHRMVEAVPWDEARPDELLVRTATGLTNISAPLPRVNDLSATEIDTPGAILVALLLLALLF